MENLFVYGTLQFPEIVKRLTGKSFRATPAVLKGYKRCSIKNCDYPAITENTGAFVKGMLLENVDGESMRQITFFEGAEYEKREVTVEINDKETVASVFVWKEDLQFLENTDWDQVLFETESLKKYC